MNIYNKLGEYFLDVEKVLKGKASAADIFPNLSDKGASREDIYVDFLKQHVPSICDVFLGGFVFGADGSYSKQLDVIITTNTCPRFNLSTSSSTLRKAFAPVDGTLAVAVNGGVKSGHAAV